jgi:O-antigen ligase
MSIVLAFWQTVRRVLAPVAEKGVLTHVALAVAGAVLVLCLRDARDLPAALTYALGAFAMFSALCPAPALLVVCGLSGLGAALPAALQLVPGSAVRLIEIPPTEPRVGEALVIAFLLGWTVRVLMTRERILESRDGLAAPTLLIGTVVVTSLLVVAAGSALSVDPQQAYSSSAYSLAASGLFTETLSLQWAYLLAGIMLEGLLLLCAAAQVSRSRPNFPKEMVRMLAVGAATVGVLACLQLGLDVIRQMAGIGGIARRSVHVKDMNAAGTQFLLGSFLAGGLTIVSAGRARRRWAVLLLPLLGGLWLSGSRTAVLVGAATLCAMLGIARIQKRGMRRLTLAVVLVVLVVAISPVNLLPAMANNQASRSALHRWRFLETSVRMWSTAPVLGVGVGQYWLRSGEFMPPELRRIYPNENAHNNFAQYWAELGLVGLAAFLWLLWAGNARVRRGVAALKDGDPTLMWVRFGLAAFLATCLTSHPLLVQPVASMFWLALGAAIAWADGAASAERDPARESATADWRLVAGRAVAATLVVFLLVSMVSRVDVERPNADLTHVKYGFTGRFVDRDAGRDYWLAGPQSAFFVRTGAIGVRFLLGGSEYGETADVEVRLNGTLASRIRVGSHQWTEHQFLMPLHGVKTPFVRVDLRVIDPAVGAAAGGPAARTRAPLRVRVCEMGPLSSAQPSRPPV